MNRDILISTHTTSGGLMDILKILLQRKPSLFFTTSHVPDELSTCTQVSGLLTEASLER